LGVDGTAMIVSINLPLRVCGWDAIDRIWLNFHTPIVDGFVSARDLAESSQYLNKTRPPQQ
jgi:hypothetical protein